MLLTKHLLTPKRSRGTPALTNLLRPSSSRTEKFIKEERKQQQNGQTKHRLQFGQKAGAVNFIQYSKKQQDRNGKSFPPDPSSLIPIVGHSMPLDVDQKEEAFPWAGKVAASSLSFSRFRYRIVSLGERRRSSPFDSGGLPPLLFKGKTKPFVLDHPVHLVNPIVVIQPSARSPMLVSQTLEILTRVRTKRRRKSIMVKRSTKL